MALLKIVHAIHRMNDTISSGDALGNWSIVNCKILDTCSVMLNIFQSKPVSIMLFTSMWKLGKYLHSEREREFLTAQTSRYVE